MSPLEFEEFVAEVWSAQGFTTTMRQQSRDRGIDFEARKDGTYTAVQVKRNSQQNNIGSQVIRSYATLYQQDDDIDNVVMVITGEFTKPGKKLADDLDVTIVDGARLAELTHEYSVPIANFVRISESPIANIEKLADELGIPFSEHFVKSWAEPVDTAFSDFFGIEINLVDQVTTVEPKDGKTSVVLTTTLSDDVEALVRDSSIDLGINEGARQYFGDQQAKSTAAYILKHNLTVRQAIALMCEAGKQTSVVEQLDAHRSQRDPSASFILGYMLLSKSIDWSLLRLTQTERLENYD
jgi:hypothetical protein